MSYYLPKNNLIFIHVPRTAGTSMGSLMPDEEKGWAQHHTKAKNYKADLPTGKFKNAFKFAFVRNPYTRFVSSYLITNNPPEKFAEFVKSIKSVDDLGSMFKPQYQFVCDETGNIIVDFVGRYENLQADWEFVCSKTGLPTELPLTNENKITVDESYYDAETRAVIRNIYSKDFELFNYG